MGAHELWKFLETATTKRTLTQIAIQEGFEIFRRGEGTIRLGIDATLLMIRAQSASYRPTPGSGMQKGENPALAVLFYQVIHLLTAPVTGIFVFDGNQRPAKKRGVDVQTKPHALAEPLKQLASLVGFYCHDAPGEAEAELARMSEKGIIDLISTNDADALLFGGTHVMRFPNIKKDGDYIKITTLAKAQAEPSVNLTPARMVLYALLAGGDYNMSGLQGCGAKNAFALSTKTPLADELYNAACNLLPGPDLDLFLQGWRERLQYYLRDNPGHILTQRLPDSANAAGSFPDVAALYNYVHPVTSWTSGSPPDASKWLAVEPDLSGMAGWCEKYFSWASRGMILDRFQSKVWVAIAVRELIKPFDLSAALAAYDSDLLEMNPVFSYSNILEIKKRKSGPGNGTLQPDVEGYNVKISTSSLIDATLSPFPSNIRANCRYRYKLQRKQDSGVQAWIPASILRRRLPAMVDRAERRLPPGPLPHQYPGPQADILPDPASFAALRAAPSGTGYLGVVEL